MHKIVENFQDGIYQSHHQGAELLKIDLEEVVRQQEDHILDLEFQLQEMTGHWQYLQAELEGLEKQKVLEKEC